MCTNAETNSSVVVQPNGQAPQLAAHFDFAFLTGVDAAPPLLVLGSAAASAGGSSHSATAYVSSMVLTATLPNSTKAGAATSIKLHTHTHTHITAGTAARQQRLVACYQPLGGGTGKPNTACRVTAVAVMLQPSTPLAAHSMPATHNTHSTHRPSASPFWLHNPMWRFCIRKSAPLHPHRLACCTDTSPTGP